MIHLSTEKIDVMALWEQAHHPAAGGVVLFSGEVRNNHQGKEVSHLSYEAAEQMANKMIAALLDEAKQRWELQVAIAVHRLGKVSVMETAVVVITAAAHRAEAYAANQYIIDRIKHHVPLWKCEHFVDGGREWGGHCSCHEEPAAEAYTI
ncbi:molybdenum cofactor biosynthesis protein MoaE [Sphingobacterium litopenaei]|jgi:molybdopterin synthase catalytic subunit|uniref:Molybdopterin synthase catalytic subunit n=2 Tax=Sphingobacterium TaxID=28453 RepID=A0ABR7YD23_9SPHI|nr:molybdenum cofactor biosynthesis protein MoaE [Sphingobacterium litopenaei]MBD1429210.1 molybdenum cofactor biosynthesis protein MoaE [Sphingobacterium litopenaei]